ncbi:MAG: hypothetical protein ACKVU4_13305 [Phycisphaerales bacterium]
MLRTSMFAAAVAVSAGSAHAVFFSFASDLGDQSWTFSGGPGLTFTDATGPNNPTHLVVDDNNGPLPPLSVSTQFNASITLTPVGSLPLGGGQFSHNYKAAGSFSFTDILSGVTLLNVTFSNGLYTSLGTEFAWGSTGGLQASAAVGSIVNMTWSGAALPGYGLAPGALGPADFGFDLSALNTNGVIPFNFQNLGVGFTPATMMPVQQWYSESSFSGSAAIPSPGALGLMTLAGLAASRRRR